MQSQRNRLKWPPILVRAAEIVAEYDTLVTLRQLFYRLVAEQVLPNTLYAYKRLSGTTAEARREGTFPDLVDTTRWIHRPLAFADAADARRWLRERFRLDRTADQDVSLYLGVEKRGLVAQLDSWFADSGIPILPLGGYVSQSFADVVRRDGVAQGRRAVLLYAGDFDPSGEDIDRDFIERAGCFDEVVRVALSAAQVREFDLPPQVGKATDPRASAFMLKYGRLVQVELDALAPNVLRRLYEDAVARFWDASRFDAILDREQDERGRL